MNTNENKIIRPHEGSAGATGPHPTKRLKTTSPDVFRLVSGTLLAATFVVVPAETGPAIADGLALHGAWRALGYAVAIVFDLVWLAALGKVPAAVRQGARTALVASLGVALLGAAASFAGVLLLGAMPALAAVPVLALAVHGLGVLLNTTMADSATDAAIRAGQLDDRNRRAKAVQGARSLAVTRTLAARARVAELTAAQDDEDALEAALTAALTAREIRRTRQAAELESGLARTAGKHGKAAAAFAERGLTGGIGSATDGTLALAEAVVTAATATVDAELDVVRSELDADDVMAVADAVAARGATDGSSGTNPQVAPTFPDGSPTDGSPRADRAVLTGRNAVRSAERAARLDVVRAEGLDATAVADRFGVTMKTARKYVADAAARTA